MNKKISKYSTNHLLKKWWQLTKIWCGFDKSIFAYTEVEIVNELVRRGV